MDPRVKKLAKILVNYSCELKKDENTLIQCYGNTPLPLVRELVKEVYAAGAIPYVTLKDDSILREVIKGCGKKQLSFMTRHDMAQMKDMDAFIGIRAHDNINELGDLPGEKMNLYMKDYSSPITDERVANTKWVVLRWPNNSMAQLAGTSLEAFEDFYFNVCTIDYSKMSKAMDSIIDLMDKTD
ncbi:aminopeptidase, partial [Actinomycetota bacterium]